MTLNTNQGPKDLTHNTPTRFQYLNGEINGQFPYVEGHEVFGGVGHQRMALDIKHSLLINTPLERSACFSNFPSDHIEFGEVPFIPSYSTSKDLTLLGSNPDVSTFI